ncbi:hypothetical protein Plhal304r1_c008g0032481 [Plasmopara halstedii]
MSCTTRIVVSQSRPMAKLAIVAALNVLLYGFHNQPDTLPELWLSLSHHLKKGR